MTGENEDVIKFGHEAVRVPERVLDLVSLLGGEGAYPGLDHFVHVFERRRIEAVGYVKIVVPSEFLAVGVGPHQLAPPDLKCDGPVIDGGYGIRAKIGLLALWNVGERKIFASGIFGKGQDLLHEANPGLIGETGGLVISTEQARAFHT